MMRIRGLLAAAGPLVFAAAFAFSFSDFSFAQISSTPEIELAQGPAQDPASVQP